MPNEIAVKKRVLIVDDDVSILHSLRRNLGRIADDWELSFAQDAGEAMLTAKLEPIDVVISDIRMPHMHGGALLKRFAEKYPETLRIAFSDKYDALTTYAITDCSHSYIAKPCSSKDLYKFVENAYAAHKQMLDRAETAAA